MQHGQGGGVSEQQLLHEHEKTGLGHQFTGSVMRFAHVFGMSATLFLTFQNQRNANIDTLPQAG